MGIIIADIIILQTHRFKPKLTMTKLPENIKYASSHTWAKLEENNLVRVGITNFAQQQLGDLVYIQLPAVNTTVQIDQACGVVESVKTASDVLSPVSGTVTAINESLASEPYLVNDEPYNAWLFCVTASNLAELESLMSASEYQSTINA